MLATLEHALNVLRHNLPHVVDFLLCRPQRILLASIRAALLGHQLLQGSIEACTSIRGQMRKVRLLGIKLGKELLLEIRQEAKRNALSELALRDDEKRQAPSAGLTGGEVGGRFDQAVREMLVLVDCAVRRRLVLECGKDERDERRGIGRGRGGVFGEDSRVVGYACAVCT
jgi:hypothetical protein